MTPAESIEVRHAGGSYPVLIGAGLFESLPDLVARWLPGRRVVVITDRNVARVVSPALAAPVLVVPAGERSKTRRRWADLTDELLRIGVGRDGALVAVGGGMVGDLAGFVAATYLRGIPFVQVPTTLLAMVDASVGGKTGVNTSRGKNLVGAFHPPAGVVADPAVLDTLGKRHLRGGLIEALKHGLVADAAYYDAIDRDAATLLRRDREALAALVRRSVAIKADIVARDEREDGVRAVLNAGHTVGHALELDSSYRLSHGDAVGLGLVVEAVLGEHHGLAPTGLAADLAGRLGRLGLAARLPDPAADDRLLAAMTRDKKVRGGEIRAALPAAPGALAARAAGWTTRLAAEDVRQALGSTRKLLAARFPT